ncbi:MAG TPA: c-type cytochrome [Burkholderiales bacterium]|nr:c-type cytochrome [Burkholderiales bacterium]
MSPTLLVTTACALLAVGCGSVAFAQGRGAKPAPNDDLRPAYANAADIAEGKRVAQAACASCHGVNGISSMRGVPHLAGQRPAYLYAELKVYQSGGRGENPMANAVKFLNDDALYKVAAYYSSLEPPPPASGSGKAAAGKPDPVQAGRGAAAACAACHGDTGVSKTPGTPSLAGLDPKYIVAATKAYKNDQRKNDLMKSLAATLSDADLNNVALFYALQKPARAQTPAAGDRAAGKAAAAACAGCHGETGVSANPVNPSLAGQDAQYLAAALLGYKQGSRGEETMKGLAASLDEAAIKNLAAYYAAQQPQAPTVRKPVSTAEWVQRCDRCHGVAGNSNDPRLPALAAQREDYLQKVLNAYRTGERKSSQMAAMSQALTESDVDSLAAYYARQKARAVVFIILPAK